AGSQILGGAPQILPNPPGGSPGGFPPNFGGSPKILTSPNRFFWGGLGSLAVPEILGVPKFFWGGGPSDLSPPQGCDLGETLARISEELRGGRDPLSVLKELLSVLGGSLGGSWARVPPPERHRRLSALLAATEGLLRGAGTRLGTGRGHNLTTPTAALSLAVSRGPPPGPVTLGVPEVTIEVPPEVALDTDSGLSLVALLTLGGLPRALEGAPPVRWDGWGSLPAPPRRGRAFRSYRLLSPVATALVTRQVTASPARARPAVTIGFGHPEPDPKLGGRVLCAFWDPRRGRWDTGGCRVVPPENGTRPGTVCACDHLTSFAVLLAFNEIQDHWLLDLVTQVALGVSVVALVASAATFALCRALGGLRRTLHLHLSLSLLGGHLAFLLGIDRAHQPVACAATAVALHLSYLSAFCWMALQGLHLHVLLVQVFPPAWLRPWHLLALGYGPPATIVVLSAAAFPGGYGTSQYCWLSLERGFRWSFQGPVIVITAVNAVILVVTLWKLVQKFNEVNPDMGHLRKIRVLLVTSLGQLTLLGSGWALGVGAGLGWAGGEGPPLPPGSAPPPLPLLFCALNATQGLLIFLCHCLGHPKVRAWYRSVLCPRWRPYSEFTSHTSNTSNPGTSRARGSQYHQ
ncbi:putative adhesion G protein-coupled receptor E4P, partial [Chamaea fasciata]|uniref:putative adhesion G protein-coupled receptor E4P n=1 Tax=Chamaea fasciata TaxID=190680 RepID=UPI003369D4CA